MALRNQPYIPLYVQDFMTDERLAECSAESTGVYIRLMCLLHKSDPYGKILLKQKYKQNVKQILNFASQVAKNLPYTLTVVERSLTELLDENVIQIEGDILFQKRMVKDGEISEKRSKSGGKGGMKTQSKHREFASKFAKAKSKANSEYESEYESESDNVINIPFSDFWDLYDKKVGDKEKLKKKWDALKGEEREQAMWHIPRYKVATPDKQFRKDPGTYLHNKSFNDEIIQSNGQSATKTPSGRNAGTLSYLDSLAARYAPGNGGDNKG